MVSPTVEKQTKMVAAEKSTTKMVQVKANTDITLDGKVYRPGQQFEVSEELAKTLSREYPVPYQFTGDASVVMKQSARLVTRL